jgi:dTDP-glucose 4,6-dehydratase
MKYCIDIDGTIFNTIGLDYAKSTPIEKAVIKVNELKMDGHYIVLFTARGTESGIDWRAVTEEQLNRFGVKYDELHFGKPSADIYIDDKAMNVVDWLK